MKNFRKILSMLLAVLMVTALLPVAAFAKGVSFWGFSDVEEESIVEIPDEDLVSIDVGEIISEDEPTAIAELLPEETEEEETASTQAVGDPVGEPDLEEGGKNFYKKLSVERDHPIYIMTNNFESGKEYLLGFVKNDPVLKGKDPTQYTSFDLAAYVVNEFHLNQPVRMVRGLNALAYGSTVSIDPNDNSKLDSSCIWVVEGTSESFKLRNVGKGTEGYLKTVAPGDSATFGSAEDAMLWQRWNLHQRNPGNCGTKYGYAIVKSPDIEYQSTLVVRLWNYAYSTESNDYITYSGRGGADMSSYLDTWFFFEKSETVDYSIEIFKDEETEESYTIFAGDNVVNSIEFETKTTTTANTEENLGDVVWEIAEDTKSTGATVVNGTLTFPANAYGTVKVRAKRQYGSTGNYIYDEVTVENKQDGSGVYKQLADPVYVLTKDITEGIYVFATSGHSDPGKIPYISNKKNVAYFADYQDGCKPCLEKEINTDKTTYGNMYVENSKLGADAYTHFEWKVTPVKEGDTTKYTIQTCAGNSAGGYLTKDGIDPNNAFFYSIYDITGTGLDESKNVRAIKAGDTVNDMFMNYNSIMQYGVRGNQVGGYCIYFFKKLDKIEYNPDITVTDKDGAVTVTDGVCEVIKPYNDYVTLTATAPSSQFEAEDFGAYTWEILDSQGNVSTTPVFTIKNNDDGTATVNFTGVAGEAVVKFSRTYNNGVDEAQTAAKYITIKNNITYTDNEEITIKPLNYDFILTDTVNEDGKYVMMPGEFSSQLGTDSRRVAGHNGATTTNGASNIAWTHELKNKLQPADEAHSDKRYVLNSDIEALAANNKFAVWNITFDENGKAIFQIDGKDIYMAISGSPSNTDSANTRSYTKSGLPSSENQYKFEIVDGKIDGISEDKLIKAIGYNNYVSYNTTNYSAAFSSGTQAVYFFKQNEDVDYDPEITVWEDTTPPEEITAIGSENKDRFTVDEYVVYEREEDSKLNLTVNAPGLDLNVANAVWELVVFNPQTKEFESIGTENDTLSIVGTDNTHATVKFTGEYGDEAFAYVRFSRAYGNEKVVEIIRIDNKAYTEVESVEVEGDDYVLTSTVTEEGDYVIAEKGVKGNWAFLSQTGKEASPDVKKIRFSPNSADLITINDKTGTEYTNYYIKGSDLENIEKNENLFGIWHITPVENNKFTLQLGSKTGPYLYVNGNPANTESTSVKFCTIDSVDGLTSGQYANEFIITDNAIKTSNNGFLYANSALGDKEIQYWSTNFGSPLYFYKKQVVTYDPEITVKDNAVVEAPNADKAIIAIGDVANHEYNTYTFDDRVKGDNKVTLEVNAPKVGDFKEEKWEVVSDEKGIIDCTDGVLPITAAQKTTITFTGEPGTARIKYSRIYEGYKVVEYVEIENKSNDFTIVYSSGKENTVEKVNKYASGLDLTEFVNTGYLYGGLYEDEDDTTPMTSAEIAAKYPGSTDGKHIVPKGGDVFYLREVSADYLMPKTITKSKYGQLYTDIVTVIDDVDAYVEAGFKATDFTYDDKPAEDFNIEVTFGSDCVSKYLRYNYSGNRAIVYTMNDKAVNTGATDGRTEIQIPIYNVEDGYLVCSSFPAFDYLINTSDYVAKTVREVQFKQVSYFVTMDYVEVTGIMDRSLTYTNTKIAGIAGDINVGDNPDVKDVEVGSETTSLEKPALTASAIPLKSKYIKTYEPDKMASITKVYEDNTKEFETVEKGDNRGNITHKETAGKLFAGWFADEGLTKAADFSNVSEGMKVYAKYVSDDFLGTYVVENKTRNAVTSLTFVSAINNTEYKEKGFILNVNGNEIKAVASKYSSIVNNTRPYAMFGGDVLNTSKLFSYNYGTKSLANGTKITVTPYWMTKDGTAVYGDSKTITYYSNAIIE